MSVSRRAFLKGSLAGAAALPAVRSAWSQAGGSASQSDLHYLSIAQAAELIRTKQLSPLELTQAVLDRIDQVEPKVHAFVTVARDEALEAARSAQEEIARGEYRGPLHGIPVGVKDTHYSKGIKTTAGSEQLEDFIPTYDATVVARLKQAGAILMGKTRLPAFSMGGNTPSANPWDLTRTPGGSSGGSAVALAAGELTGATGGDTSNSIRHPSTLCNVVGMKATFGLVSRYGVIPISWSLDHIGPMTRTVEDSALMLNVLAGYDPLDDYTVNVPIPDYTKALGRGVRGIRIGIPPDSLIQEFHADCIKAFRDALDVYKKLGAEVVEVEMPSTLQAMDSGQRVIRICEAASYHEHHLAHRADRYGEDPGRPRTEAEVGALIPAVHYLRAQKLRKVFMKEMHQLFGSFDVFITPGRPAPAGEPMQFRVTQDFAKMFNCSGFPALVLPAGFSTSPPGLPVGLQIAARPFEEEIIYRVAYAYEAETDWHERRPNL
ncbi:amidase family protein [Acidobacteria bacterium AH-259-D05]|nr:amidase family protein [Acidobacteria bacterium AH-259-D05]